MANASNGEVSFDYEGKTYTLRFSTNALCELEEKIGDSMMNVLDGLGKGNVKVSTMRSMFWAALRDKSPDIDERVAGNLMDGIGMTRAFELTGKAFALAFPEEAGPLAGKGKRRR